MYEDFFLAVTVVGERCVSGEAGAAMFIFLEMEPN